MRTHARLLSVAAVTAALTLWFLATAGSAAGAKDKKPAIPETALADVVKESAGIIRTALEKDPSDKKTPALVRTNAFMIALAAQHALTEKGADVKQLATLRQAALNLADAAGKKVDLDEARKQLEVLVQFPKLTADPNVKADPVSLKDKFDIDEIMNVLAPATKGGQGIERELLDLGQQKKPYTEAQMSNKLVLDAYKMALIADLTAQVDDSAKAKGKVKEWQTMSQDMHQAALEVMGAVQDRQPKPLKASIKKLNATCSACHVEFK